MNLDGDASTDEYFVTASQIFDYCGADSTGTLRVDILMNKFAPFVKSNRAEFGTKIAELKSLLDPNQCNPEITVSRLAMTLNKYSESQKIKVDLEESFNLKGEQAPHDSDSGISTDGFQLLEDLQCELREKSHLAHQLRSQLDFTDRQHEEALAGLSAERDSLRAHVNILREENMTLTHVRRDYEEACERLCGCERALEEARRELDAAGRRARALQSQLAALDAEKLTLQEQLTRSKEECHRINEMYASRQAALRQENEAFRAEHADLAARLQDQEEFMQQLIKEKVLLEMELKDMLNKSNQTHLRVAERSIDVSYTEDQMLTELDSLNADSRFVQEHHLLDEESFVNALRDDQGRSTNISLFHELRLSFCNMSRNNLAEQLVPEKLSDNLDTSFMAVATQTDEYESELKDDSDKLENRSNRTLETVGTQTEPNDEIEPSINRDKIQVDNVNVRKTIAIQYEYLHSVSVCVQTDEDHHINNHILPNDKFNGVKCVSAHTQTDTNENDHINNNNIIQNCIDCSNCIECERLKTYSSRLENDVRNSHETISNMRLELVLYEDNLNVLKRFVNEGNDRNRLMEECVEHLKSKLVALESVCNRQGDRIQEMCCETESVLVQTECEQLSVASQAELPCSDCVSRKTTSSRSLKKYLWEPLKWLFQVFAVVCFACAVCVLYAVTTRARAACRDAPAVPWRWLHAQDLMDLLLRIEYVADVPM